MDKRITIATKLQVPLDQKLRKRLRKETRLLIADKQLSPPVDLIILQQLANKILFNLGLGVEYLDFVTVLCGNEIWREVVAATPMSRRLLLLPQCLKNSTNCKGELDELGLICAGCKSCLIDEVLCKAEALGYTTLVAEGTTVAVGLVEEGAIDAVIGVSCMSVLQRSFEPVSRSAVPVMGIPLLNDGCENTTVDSHWLFEEIGIFNENPEIQPLSVSVLKNQVLDYFTDQNINDFFPVKNETERLAKQMITVGGQRIRPLLSVLAYRSYTHKVNEKVQVALAFIIECFHKASLIHDDIEDDDDFRYRKKTLHATHGTPIAINVGDYLVGKGYKLLSELTVDPAVLVQSLKAVSSSHLKLSEGQGDDLLLKNRVTGLSVDQLLKIFILKSGEAIKVALVLGAINGGASKLEIDRLESFADCLGIAYQVRDDVSEFQEDQSENLNNFPFLLALLNDRLIELDELNLLKKLETLKAKELCELIVEKQIDIEADRLLQSYIEKCYALLDQLQNLKMKLSLYHLMAKIFN